MLNRLIDVRTDLAACAQLEKAKGHVSVSKSSHLRGNFSKLNRKLHDKSLRLNPHLDQEEWSAPHHTGGVLTTAAVCLMSGHHDCPTVIAINADRLKNCLMSSTPNVQSLQKHAILEKA